MWTSNWRRVLGIFFQHKIMWKKWQKRGDSLQESTIQPARPRPTEKLSHMCAALQVCASDSLQMQLCPCVHNLLSCAASVCPPLCARAIWASHALLPCACVAYCSAQARCPACGGKTFPHTAHVSFTWASAPRVQDLFLTQMAAHTREQGCSHAWHILSALLQGQTDPGLLLLGSRLSLAP